MSWLALHAEKSAGDRLLHDATLVGGGACGNPLPHPRSLDLARLIGDRRSEAIALENLALGHIALAQREETAEALRQGRKIARKIKDKERLFSLELVEIESRLARPGIAANRRSLLAIKAKLTAAGQTLKKAGYTAELPRLLRLQTRAHILACETRGEVPA